jgi:hypothetical protein
LWIGNDEIIGIGSSVQRHRTKRMGIQRSTTQRMRIESDFIRKSHGKLVVEEELEVSL